MFEIELNEGDPAPYKGVLITKTQFEKYKNDELLLNWVNVKLKDLLKLEQ